MAINWLPTIAYATKHFHKHLPSYLSASPDMDHMHCACLTVTHSAVCVKNGSRNTKLSCQEQGQTVGGGVVGGYRESLLLCSSMSGASKSTAQQKVCLFRSHYMGK